MDGSFFAFALVGGLLGYIVGDFQRELRIRREVRANLALSLGRSGTDTHTNDNGTGTNDHGTGTGTNVYGTGTGTNVYGNGGTFDGARREARRRAVRGDNYGLSLDGAVAGRNFRVATAPPVGKRRSEIDCY